MKNTIKLEIFNNIKVESGAQIISFKEIKDRNENIKNKINAEIALWKAVIMQSVLDLMSTSKRTEVFLAKKSAGTWLDKRNVNFVTVCNYANLEPDWVLKKIDFAIKNPRMWRRECDLKKYFLSKEP